MKKKMGCPEKDINWDEVDQLCAFGCTQEEIVEWTKVSQQTLDRRVKRDKGLKTFGEYLKQKAQIGHVSLRRKQMQIAMQGNVTMLIWLGKQRLKQSDKIEQKIDFQNLSDAELDQKIKELEESLLGPRPA